MANGFNGGLNSNYREHQQPDDTYRYALNMMIKPDSLGALNTEVGLEKLFTFEGNIIGSKNISNDEIVLCLQNPDEIVLINTKTKTVTSLLKSNCLNFKQHVQMEHKILKGCENIIYLVDSLNEDRVINITHIFENPTSHMYLDSNGNLDCTLLKEKANVEYGNIKNITILDSGGNLPVGTYEIILQLEDETGYQTPYFAHSLPFPISLGPDKNVISLGQDDLTDPLSSKSIVIELENLDPKYKYVNVIVGHTNSNTIKAYFKLLSRSIEDNIITIDSLERTSDITVEEITTIRNIYDVSKTITQIDNRLIKGNVQSKIIDYQFFQQQANKIKTKYVTKQIKYSNESELIPKTENYYLDNRSYLRDEVYDLGIVWVFKNGFETPVFHIPGRQAIGFDNQPFLYKTFTDENPNIEEVTNIPKSEYTDNSPIVVNTNGKTIYNYYIDKWKVQNTSQREALPNEPEDGGTYSKGRLSYFESNYRYPDIKDCDGNYIYPRDLEDNSKPAYIRYHKMPSSSQEPFFREINSQYYIYPLGLEFTNIVPPAKYANEIQGYYIVRQQRTDNNKTILDKGLAVNNYMFRLTNPNLNNTWYSFNVQPNLIGNHFWERAKYSGDYETLGRNTVQYIKEGFIPLYSEADDSAGKTKINSINTNWDNYSNPYTYSCSKCNSESSCINKLDRLVIPDLRSVSFYSPLTKALKPAMNPSFLSLEYSLKSKAYGIDYKVTNPKQLSKLFINATLNVPNYSNSDKNLSIYKRPYYINKDIETNETYLSKPFNNKNAQDTVVLELKERDYFSFSSKINKSIYNFKSTPDINGWYVAIKNYNRNIYGSISTRTYVKTHTNLNKLSSCIVFGGDIFINRYYHLQSSATKMVTRGGSEDRERQILINELCSNNDRNNNNDSNIFTVVKSLFSFFVESEINVDLRSIDLKSTEFDNTFFPYYSGTANQLLNIDYADSGDAEEGTSGFSWYKQRNYFKDKFIYNKAFSEESGAKKYFSLDSKFDYCSECQEKFINRIIYSEPANEEGNVDNFRIFYANNYKDLPASKGELNKLFVNFDYLYAATDRTLFILPVKDSQLQVDSETIFLGNADFLNAPIKEIISTDYGMLGNNQPQSFINTEMGTLYLDTVSNSIYFLGNTKTGPQNISDESLSKFLKDEMNFYFNDWWKEKYKENYPLYNQPSVKNGIGFITGYDPKYKRIFITKIDYKPLYNNFDLNNLNFNNKEMFENKSWTISYSLLNGKFISYHSYLPNYYITNGLDNYRSILTNKSLYKQVDNNYRNYFDISYPSIIDFIVKHEGVGTLENINYFQKCDLNGKDLKDETFKYVTVYNSEQSSGKLPITFKSNPFDRILNSDKLFVDINEQIWSISKFRDNVVNYNTSLFVKDWNQLKYDYPIDRIDNILAFGNKSPFEKEMLRDLYTGVRLEYKSDLNTNLMVDVMLPTIKNSIK